MTMPTTEPVLVLRRTYAATPQRLYEAWTQPELMKQFVCPEDTTVKDVSVDARAGGAYRMVMVQPSGEEFIAKGVYRVVEPGRKLVMTWTWEEDDASQEHETLLTLEFLPNPKGSELVLTHERFASIESRDRHEHGWTSVLDRFETLT